MADEKYRHPPQPTVLFRTSADDSIADEKAYWAGHRALLDRMAAEVPIEQATFQNVVLLFEHSTNRRWSAIEPNFYRTVSPDAERRQAGLEAQKLAHAANIECSMRDDIFRLVEAVYQREEGLDVESQRALQETRREGIRSGLGLPPGPDRVRFKAISERLSELKLEYDRTVDEESGGTWFTPEELDGVPQDVLARLEKGTEEPNVGKLKVPFKGPDIKISVAHSPETRKRYGIAWSNRCNENVPRFREIMALRHESARMLGYPNYAAMRLEQRMAKTPEAVITFLEDLRAYITPRAKEEISEILAVKEAHLASLGKPFDGCLYSWDLGYYSRLLEKKKFDVDYQTIAEYFPLYHTISGMLSIFGQLLRLVFVELKTDEDRGRASPTGKAADILWHESVVLYTVWEDDDEEAPEQTPKSPGFIGYLYLDLHPRPGKHARAVCLTVRSGYQNVDGTRCYPATCLLANFSPATDSRPALLPYRDMITLFHELGHCMHDLVSRTTYARFHGVSVARDFIEAPSQMLENWCRIPSCLSELSAHYETGERIPLDLLERLVEAKRESSALDVLGQLGHAAFDMAIHTFPMHEREPDYGVMFNRVYREVTGVKGSTERNNGYATSSSLIYGNDAGYYGYLWSKVYSADMFDSVFREDPMSREAGRRYRRMVLEKGGAQDEMLTLEQFLGRKPSPEAFFRDLGWS
ncbi:Saccharolysin 1 [Echria macrotheca]|uniref:Saccharolysin 1 n=1 Tax=Echria macrotheca TaxID=438768 RepID=A0AAJ0BKQ7_9PEZI|nr:Saccharolysin 1 [Echria macrotheca]